MIDFAFQSLIIAFANNQCVAYWAFWWCFLLLCQKCFKTLLCLMNNRIYRLVIRAWDEKDMILGVNSMRWPALPDPTWNRRLILSSCSPGHYPKHLLILKRWKLIFQIVKHFKNNTAKWVWANFLLKLLGGFHLKISETFVGFVVEKTSGIFTQKQCRKMVYTDPQVCCQSRRPVRSCSPSFWGHRRIDHRL